MRAIAAMATNRVIGKDGKLPWKIKGDLKFFKKMTEGCICIVGRKTFDELPYLPNRRFVVESKQIDRYKLGKNNKAGNEICGINLDSSGSFLPVYTKRDDAWVIGGASIYKYLLKYCSDLYLTHINSNYDGDTFFPSFEHMFTPYNIIELTKEYKIIHYKNNAS